MYIHQHKINTYTKHTCTHTHTNMLIISTKLKQTHKEIHIIQHTQNKHTHKKHNTNTAHI